MATQFFFFRFQCCSLSLSPPLCFLLHLLLSVSPHSLLSFSLIFSFLSPSFFWFPSIQLSESHLTTITLGFSSTDGVLCWKTTPTEDGQKAKGENPERENRVHGKREKQRVGQDGMSWSRCTGFTEDSQYLKIIFSVCFCVHRGFGVSHSGGKNDYKEQESILVSQLNLKCSDKIHFTNWILKLILKKKKCCCIWLMNCKRDRQYKEIWIIKMLEKGHISSAEQFSKIPSL